MSETLILPAFTKLTDLAAAKFGGKALRCSDDFFAEKENLLKTGRGVFIADKYTERGKWMDGWESRRKRIEGNDWCIIRLGASGFIRGIDIDTNHFLGNHPSFASVEACKAEAGKENDIDSFSWTEILPKSALNAGSQNFFEINNDKLYSHIRLNIFPDGGVARLKVYGEVYHDWKTMTDQTVDLAAVSNGAKAISCNDMFFSHMDNLIMPGRGINMGDGWETKRNRTPGNSDWVIVRLAHKGEIERVLIDTCHFKGNYPDRFLLEGCAIDSGEESKITTKEIKWQTIIAQTRLQPDHEHYFSDEISTSGPFTHVRLTIFPDGGISRMRLFGKIKS
jgi:allantoicase